MLELEHQACTSLHFSTFVTVVASPHDGSPSPGSAPRPKRASARPTSRLGQASPFKQGGSFSLPADYEH